MVNIFSSMQQKMIANWVDPKVAEKVAYFNMRKRNMLAAWSYRLNEEWKEYGNLTSEERALIRKSKADWRPITHYEIVNGRVRLRSIYRAKPRF